MVHPRDPVFEGATNPTNSDLLGLTHIITKWDLSLINHQVMNGHEEKVPIDWRYQFHI